MDPDCKAAIETLVSHGCKPATVAECMHRVLIHRQRRARVDASERIRQRELLNAATPHLED